MLDNIVTILTSVAGVLIALWRFGQSPLGQALISAWQSGSVLNARAFLEKQALCIATKYQQTLVSGLKEDLADGKITKEELRQRLQNIKILALNDFKASAAGGAVLQALQVLGVQDIDKTLDQLLEGAVHLLRSKASKELPSGVLPMLSETGLIAVSKEGK